MFTTLTNHLFLYREKDLIVKLGLLIFNVQKCCHRGRDTLAVNAQHIGITLYYTTDAAADA